MSKKSCIFCGQPANSKEHLIPDWILVALGGVNPSVLKLRGRDTQARRDGVEVRAGRLVLLGLWAVPVVVIMTTVALSLSFALVR
jgi:hypothetical protein